MTQVIAQVRFTSPTGVNVNSFNFESTAFATYALHAASVANALISFYCTDGGGNTTSIGAYMASWISRGAEIRCYNRADAKPRVPLIFPMTLPNAHTPDTLNKVPMDTAFCLSFHAAPPVTRRRRGRIYLTGIQNEWMREGSLGSPVQLVTGVGTPCARILTQAATLMGTNTGWGIWSSVNESIAPIVGGSLDVEPDTQRRRGAKGAAKQNWGS